MSFISLGWKAFDCHLKGQMFEQQVAAGSVEVKMLAELVRLVESFSRVGAPKLIGPVGVTRRLAGCCSKDLVAG
jgi:hypothetical protein